MSCEFHLDLTWTELGHRTWLPGLVRLLHQHPGHWYQLVESVAQKNIVPSSLPGWWMLPGHSRIGKDLDRQLSQGSLTAQLAPDWEKVARLCGCKIWKMRIHLSLGKHISELGNCVWCVELHPKCPARMAWSLVIWRLKPSVPGEINSRQGIYRNKMWLFWEWPKQACNL